MKKKKEEQPSSIDYFKQNNYLIIDGAITKELASFCYIYFQNKRKVWKHLHDTKYISPFDETFGVAGDIQIPNSYSHYCDIVMDTLLLRVMPKMEQLTGLQLVPTYSYARIYKFGDLLERHTDRDSCEISTTLNLGGDQWPIFLEPSGERGKEGIKVELNPGDMLVYRGNILEHWRETFEGYDCGQVFLHYNDKNGPFGESNLYDGKPMIGLPSFFNIKNK